LAQGRGPVTGYDGVPVVELLEGGDAEPVEPSCCHGLIFRPDPGRPQIGQRAVADRITHRTNAAPDKAIGFDDLNAGACLAQQGGCREP
jgi:hypothetical protein